jgi:hypothetical protein
MTFKNLTASMLLAFICMATTTMAQTTGQKGKVPAAATNQSRSSRVDKPPVTAPVKKEVRVTDANRSVQIIDGRKVLVDKQGTQSFANPDLLPQPAATNGEKK